MKLWLSSAVAGIGLLCACTVGTPLKDGGIITTNAGIKGTPLVLKFERGPEWLLNKKMGPTTIRITPQIAVWIEDTSGKYQSTLYVTQSFGAQKWKFLKPNPDTCFRPMCMPYWMNKYVSAGNPAPTRNHPVPDAVTAATPAGSFTLTTMVPEGLSVFTICVEYNRSFDKNETYTERRKESRFNGQPSAVFAGRVDLKDTARAFDTLKLIGRGGENGSDAALYRDTEKLTTALAVFSSIVVQRKKG
jgi:hypothetical protein